MELFTSRGIETEDNGHVNSDNSTENTTLRSSDTSPVESEILS